MQKNEILDNNSLDKPQEKPPLSVKLLHGLEIIFILFFLLGLFEKVEHTQFIPGISLLSLSLKAWTVLSIILLFIYEKYYQKLRKARWLLISIFSILLLMNNLFFIEKLEHIQYLSIFPIYFIKIPLAILYFILATLHIYRIKEPKIYHYILLVALGIFLASGHLARYIFLGFYFQIIIFLIITILAIFCFANKIYFKHSRYFYIRAFVLLLLGF